MTNTTDMTVGSPTKHILTFALPLILTNLGQQLYMIVDAAIVGRGVGVKALAAVGSTDWCYWLILWSVTGLTQGFSTFVSRYFGEKNYQDMNKVISMAGSILRAFGDGKTSLVAMVIAALLNISLDCLFVFVFQWGIFGAAFASVLAQLVSFLFCLRRIQHIEYVDIKASTWTIDRQMIIDLLAFGLPLAGQYIIIALGGIILQSSVNLQGSIFVAGYTATNKVYGLLECSATALGTSCCTFSAQNFGAGNYSRFRQGVCQSLKVVVAMAVLVLTMVLLFRRFLLQLFLNTNEAGGPQALEIAVRYLTIMTGFLVILYLLHIFRNALQAMEISLWSLLSGLTECVCRIFMAKVVIHHMGSDALFVCEPVAWTGALLCVMLPYFYYQRRFLNK